MNYKNIEDLLIQELEDLYDNEKQIIVALEKLQKESLNGDLKKAFRHHHSETREQIQRLDRIFKMLNHTSKHRPNAVTRALLEKGESIIKGNKKSELRDVALIGASQKIEHYEISSYGTARAHAKLLNLYEIGDLLKNSQSEEEEANNTLNKIAEGSFLSSGLNTLALRKERKEKELVPDVKKIAPKKKTQRKAKKSSKTVKKSPAVKSKAPKKKTSKVAKKASPKKTKTKK